VREELEEMLQGKTFTTEEKELRIQEIAKECNVAQFLSTHSYDLSGGEQQRVALSKVLLCDPKIVLLDEPTKGIDCFFKEQFADILNKLKTPVEEKEIRIRINEKDFVSYGNAVLEDFKEYADNTKGIERVKLNFEGVKVNFEKKKGDGWLLMRLSLHEPLLVVNCESNSLGGIEKMVESLKVFLNKYDVLDLKF
jgi:ABC-type phosphate/phosphonate transport system ATPase subunit